MLRDLQLNPDLPLFEQLLEADQAIQQQFPRSYGAGLEGLGLILRKPAAWENGGYYCTPVNSLCFGRTGVDGEHFSFLVQEGVINSQSPIIVTAPCAYDSEMPNAVVAETFEDFIGLGLRYGFGAVVEFVWNLPKALQAYGVDTTETDYNYSECDLSLPAEQQEVLLFLRERLQITSIGYTVEQFEQLQRCYMGCFRMSTEWNDCR